jgi:hypothetical protein
MHPQAETAPAAVSTPVEVLVAEPERHCLRVARRALLVACDRPTSNPLLPWGIAFELIFGLGVDELRAGARSESAPRTRQADDSAIQPTPVSAD